MCTETDTVCPIVENPVPQWITYCPLVDSDGDGVIDCGDDIPGVPDGPNKGVCVQELGKKIVSTGKLCTDDTDCAAGEVCMKHPGDCNWNGIGDGAECYNDCDCDGDIDVSDLVQMRVEFFRNDCRTKGCMNDVNDDGKVSVDDLMVMKVQFLRDDCPPCPQ